MYPVLTIGIAGGTGSGKSTLANNIATQFAGRIAVLHHDDYYKANDAISLKERTALNYDAPEAFETELLLTHLRALKNGEGVACPQYDFEVYNRAKATRYVAPAPVVLLDGILILQDPALCELLDIKIFVDAEADVRILRRLMRDVRRRGRSVESVVNQYLNTVKPMHDRYVEPSKKNADLIVPGGGKNRAASEMLAARIEWHLAESAKHGK